MKKTIISSPEILNEAYDYEKPSAFSRGLKVEILPSAKLIYISGTASVDEKGHSIHIEDFASQTIRTFDNITSLLKSAGARWKDIVKTTIYIRDIERDYEEFNKIRCQFYNDQKLEPYPASVCVQAHLCRKELLIEIEAQAIIE